MIAALICGIGEKGGQLPGRNMIPVLGRPLLTYPLLAAYHSASVQHIAISTNSPAMADVARNFNAQVIWRPEELSRPQVDMGQVYLHGLESIEKASGQQVHILVILLANAPAITSELIDQATELLQVHLTVDSVATVTRHNEYNPSRACYISRSGKLTSLLAPPLFPVETHQSRDALGDVYFIDNSLRVLRRSCLFDRYGVGHLPYPWMGENTTPIVHEGGYDVDYDWQIPGIERWLMRHGFSIDSTPYSNDKRTEQSIILPPLQSLGNTTGQVLVTTVPFGEIDTKPLQLLRENNLSWTLNPIGRRLREEELAELIEPYEVLIAGTEPITSRVLEHAHNLRLIARVGIGLDNVALKTAQEKGISVTYTPDAPAPAVAELTMGQMLAALRHTHAADRGMRQGVWQRRMGRRLSELTVGIIGVGRIGSRVIRHLQGWSPVRILANDLVVDDDMAQRFGFVWVDKGKIYREADIISLHIPLTPQTRNLVTKKEMLIMKEEAILINTSRGGIINEADLAEILRSRHQFTAAVDAFELEPYNGELVSLENCLLTCHMGSGTHDCRLRMEVEATEEVVRYFTGHPFANPVPEVEYTFSIE